MFLGFWDKGAILNVGLDLTISLLEDVSVIFSVYFNIISRIDILSPSSDTALRWVSENFIDEKSTSVQVMSYCH